MKKILIILLAMFAFLMFIACPDTTPPAEPTFDPAQGAVESGTEITISCTTAEADIYYTTDGSEPTNGSTAYDANSKPTITEATTIKAIAYKGDLFSTVATANYTLSQATNVPNAVTDLAATAGPHEVELTWSAPATDATHDEAESYKIYYAEGSTVDTSGTLVNNATSPRTISGLTPDTEYAFIILASNIVGDSAASGVVTATPEFDVYALTLTITPEGLTTAETEVVLDPVQPAAGYNEGTDVTLTPQGSYLFSYWDGADSGDIVDNEDGTYTLTMDADKEIEGVFLVATDGSTGINEPFEGTDADTSGTIEWSELDSGIPWGLRTQGDNSPELPHIQDTVVHGGTHAVQFGSIESATYSNRSIMEIGLLNVPADYELKFWIKKTSYEGNGWTTIAHSFGLFLNGTSVYTLDEIQDWTEVTVILPAGDVELLFYTFSGNQGPADGIYIDDLTVAPGTPAIEVSYDGNSFPSSTTIPYDTGVHGVGTPVEFLVENTGTSALEISAINYAGTLPAEITMDYPDLTTPYVIPVTPDETYVPFTITINASAVIDFTSDAITIVNNTGTDFNFVTSANFVTPPNAPENVTATAVAGSGVAIDFDVPSTGDTPTEYRIYQSEETGGGAAGYEEVAVIDAADLATLPYIYAGGFPGTTQYFVVKSVIVSGSNSIISLPSTEVSEVPTAIEITVGGYQEVDLPADKAFGWWYFSVTGGSDYQVMWDDEYDSIDENDPDATGDMYYIDFLKEDGEEYTQASGTAIPGDTCSTFVQLETVPAADTKVYLYCRDYNAGDNFAYIKFEEVPTK